MQHSFTILTLATSLVLTLGTACSTPTAAGSLSATGENDETSVVTMSTPAEVLASLTWMEGRWRGENTGRLWDVTYTGPEGGQILSLNKQIKDDKVVFFEFERFSTSDTDVILWPYPAGRNSVSFRLVEHDPETMLAVFENLAHDFPKRIIYGRTGNILKIDVSGERGGKETGFTLVLHLAK